MEDKDFIRLQAEQAEFDRAKERLTLKHRNTSQWARRALKRGVDMHDDGELPIHTLLLVDSQDNTWDLLMPSRSYCFKIILSTLQL